MLPGGSRWIGYSVVYHKSGDNAHRGDPSQRKETGTAGGTGRAVSEASDSQSVREEEIQNGKRDSRASS